MIYISKKSTPLLFENIKRQYKSYDDLHGDDKQKMKETLLKEQDYLCAYCMSRISLESCTIEHYIPRNGPYGNKSLELEYKNLFVVCDNVKRDTLSNKQCYSSKGCDLLFVDPRNKFHIEQIKYKNNGEITSDNERIENDLNIMLNLNNITLTRNRKVALQTYITILSKIKRGKWAKEFCEKQLKKLERSEQKIQYAGIILYFLQKKIKS